MQKALSRIGFQMEHGKETRISKGNNSQLIERIKIKIKCTMNL